MAALGIPLALVLGAVADLVGSLLRPERRPLRLRRSRDDLRRALSGREPATILEGAGGGAALLGAGMVASAAIGAAPGDPALLTLTLALAVAGAHLAASEPVTRPAAVRARARLLESGLAFAGAAAGLVTLFWRWRATDLASVWGAGEVLGSPLGVAPAAAALGQGLAVLALAAAAGLLVPLETGPPHGRSRRPAAAALLLRLSRWALAGAVAALVPAFLVGFDLTGRGDAASFAAWSATALAGAAVVGVAWGGLDRLRPGLRLRVAVPALVALSAAAALLVSVGR